MSNEIERESNKISADLTPVSVYQLFAKMFAHLSKEVVEQFGEEGKEAVKRAVWNFGVERGKDIARRAEARGLPNTPENYLSSYDMDRSDEFESVDTYGDNQVEQVFTRCVFAEQFRKDKMQQYGILYCQMIDPAIAYGYNKDMACTHDKHIFTDDVCTFCFKVDK